MRLRQLFDQETGTFTYLIVDEQTNQAGLIDPVREQVERDLKLVGELGAKLTHIFETHVHADHVTGAGILRERTGAKTFASSRGAPCIDTALHDGAIINLGSLQIHAIATPGHTDDSFSFLVEDAVFTGDSLLIRGCGRTDFQNGDAPQLYRSITQKLFALPDATRVFPGHDYTGVGESSIGEEKRCNPRLAGKNLEQFVNLMEGLKLPPPRKIAESVPANRACGMALQG